jgi:hypothetical protein
MVLDGLEASQVKIYVSGRDDRLPPTGDTLNPITPDIRKVQDPLDSPQSAWVHIWLVDGDEGEDSESEAAIVKEERKKKKKARRQERRQRRNQRAQELNDGLREEGNFDSEADEVGEIEPKRGVVQLYVFLIGEFDLANKQGFCRSCSLRIVASPGK